MKKILIATLFILSILPAIGQDNTKANDAKWQVFKVSKPDKAFDTIRVVMLVCDTTSSRWVDSAIRNGKRVQIGEWHKNYHNKEAYWQQGYSVREFKRYVTIEINNGWGGSYEEPFYKHIEYLGEDKKPLFNKIVWMAKEVGK